MAVQRGSRFCSALVLTATILMSASFAFATVIPPDLPVGSQYQLIFLTHDTTTAASADIGTYNTFVNQEAALSSGLPVDATWSAIASTQSVNANANVSTSSDIPIYTTSGVLVAASGTALWQTGTTPLLSSVTVDQYGNTWYMDAWTGTQADGTAVSGAALGQWNSTLTVGPAIGCGFFVNSSWLDAETYSSSQGGNTQALSLYALSSVITVPAPVPEPSTFALLPSVAVSLLAYAWRRRTLTA